MTRARVVELHRAIPKPESFKPKIIHTMKFLTSFTVLALAISASGEEKAKPVFRDAATHEQLSLALRKAQQLDPMKKLASSEGADPTKVNQPTNLLEQSDIICFGGIATLVPKRAIIATPAKHKDRLGIQPGARIVGWTEFYTLNRGWIHTVEVTREQAEGRVPFAEATQETIGKSTNLVVATFKGGPISVLPVREPEPETETAQIQP